MSSTLSSSRTAPAAQSQDSTSGSTGSDSLPGPGHVCRWTSTELYDWLEERTPCPLGERMENRKAFRDAEIAGELFLNGGYRFYALPVGVAKALDMVAKSIKNRTQMPGDGK